MGSKSQEGPWIMPRPVANKAGYGMHKTPFWRPPVGAAILVWSAEQNVWVPLVYEEGCLSPGDIWKSQEPVPDKLLLVFAEAYATLPYEKRDEPPC
jgi:hypothetical protein